MPKQLIAGLVSLLLVVFLTAKDAAAEGRFALVIGNSTYQNASFLTNTKNDASDVAAALKRLGFEVTTAFDLNSQKMRRALRDFGHSANGASMAIVFYAGHGLEISKQNYLIPTDARLRTDLDVYYEAVPLDLVMAAVGSSRGLKLVLLDACRNNPFARSFRSSGGGGLAPVQAPKGTFIAYATAPGQVALDGENSENSPYTEALSRAISEPGLSLETVFKRTRSKVLEVTGEQQVPWETSSITGEFYFKPAN